MAPRAGYATVLEVGGTPTAVTGEACTNTTGNTYQINTSAKRVWDPTVAVVAKDGGTPVAVSSVDWFFGKVTLASPPGGAVTVDVTYIPRLAVAYGKAENLDVSVDALDVSVFGSQDRTYIAGLRTATASFETLDTLDTDLDSGGGTWTWRGKSAGTLILASIDTSGAGTEFHRFWCYIAGLKQGAKVDSVLMGTIDLQSTALTAVDGSIIAVGYGS